MTISGMMYDILFDQKDLRAYIEGAKEKAGNFALSE